MADLYRLLEELEENEIADRDKKEDDPRRRLTVDTAVTEAMSEDNRQEDDDDDDDYDDYEVEDGLEGRVAVGTTTTTTPQIPLALQEAQRRRDDYHEFDDYDGDDQNDLSQGGKQRTVSGSRRAYYDIADDIFGSNDKEQERLFPPNELYERLHYLWLQERHCPELLEYDDEMVSSLLEEFEERQEGIDQLLESADAVELLMAHLAQQDLDRAKFVLSDWLTQRLDKIEAHPLHMREKVSHMSDKEIEYLQGYGALMEHHLKATVLDVIPEAWQALDEPNMIDKPDYDGFHFWRVHDLDTVEIEHEGKGCIVAKYSEMREKMRERKVELLI
jgi:GINS complex subunit 4